MIDRNKLAIVVDFPEPVEPKTAECRVISSSRLTLAGMLSALERDPITICPNSLVPYIRAKLLSVVI